MPRATLSLNEHLQILHDLQYLMEPDPDLKRDTETVAKRILETLFQGCWDPVIAILAPRGTWTDAQLRARLLTILKEKEN